MTAVVKSDQTLLMQTLTPFIERLSASCLRELDIVDWIWPMYCLMQYPEDLKCIWKHHAADHQVPFIASIVELGHVQAGLNESSTQALRSGVLWIRKAQEFTPDEHSIGVTFHPSLCSSKIGLMTPQQWHQLHYLIFPCFELLENDAARLVTGVCDKDQPDWSQMTAEIRKNILIKERGIHHVDPTKRKIDAELLGLFSFDLMKHYGFIPLQYEQEKSLLHCCMIDIDNHQVHHVVQQTLKCTVQPYYMDKTEADSFWSLGAAAHECREKNT